MRKLIATLTVAAGLAVAAATGAEAAHREYAICWTGLNGGEDCATLPRTYKLPGIAKPLPSGGTTSFTLTWRLIRCLSRYVKTDNMRPYQDAVIYAPKT